MTGMVEEFSRRKVLGWIAVSTGAKPIRVSLCLNNVEIAATWATADATKRNNWGEVRSFAFALKDVWRFAKAKDRLTVRVKGKALPIAGHGMYLHPECDGAKSLVVLKKRLAAGYIFGQKGRLQLSKKLDTVWQGQVMDLYDEVRSIVAEAYGHDVFFIYGSLLGAVRENGFIGHDLDFDSAYLSAETEGAAAAAELKRIAFTLIERGLNVECHRSALHVHDKVDPAVRIDLFHLYFNEAGEMQYAFGVAGTSTVSAASWRGTKEIEFLGRRGVIPQNAEEIVEHIYGAGWRKPKPGFDWDRDRTNRDWSSVLPTTWVEEVYWANFYAHMESASGSPFFELVNAREDMPGTVIDVGCGDGRDSVGFGLAGRRVIGIDRSEVGVQHAAKKAESMGLGDRVDFRGCDVGEAAQLRAILVEAIGGTDSPPVLFYLRFFLHSIPEEVQETLMSVIADAARDGDMIAAEFRTEADAAKAKVYTKHYRRFQNGPAFGAQLRERYGFVLLDEAEGTGLSPYQDEDPELYRVVARRGPA